MSVPKKRYAVLISAEKEGDNIRIILDDVASDAASEKTWVKGAHYTNKLYRADTFEDVILDDDELISIGSSVVARLLAFVERNEN